MTDTSTVSSVNELDTESVAGDELKSDSPSEDSAASPSDEHTESDAGLSEEELSSVFPEPKRDPDEDRRNMTEALIEKNVDRISQIEDEDEREAMLSKFPKLRDTVEARLMDKELSGASKQKETEYNLREQNLLRKELNVEMLALPAKLKMDAAEFTKHKPEFLKRLSELRATEYGKHMPISELLEYTANKLGLQNRKTETDAEKAAKDQTRKDMALPSTSGKRSPSFQLLTSTEVDALTQTERSAYLKESQERYGEHKYK